MERLDYASLARAVDAPMKRWWKRTGWWWLLLPLGAVAYQAVVAFHLSGSRVNTYGFQAPWTTKVLVGLGEITEILPFAAMLVLWLLAAQQANHLFTALIREANAPEDGRASRFMFRCGLRQGLIPLCATVVFCMLTPLVHHFGILARHNSFSTPSPAALFQDLNTGLNGGFYLASAALWLVAIAVVTVKRPVLVWLIAVPVFVLPGLVCFVLNTMNNSGFTSITSRPNFSGALVSGPSYFFYVGLAAVIFLIWGFRNLRVVTGWAAYGILLGGAALKTLIACSLRWLMGTFGPSPTGTYLFEIGKLTDSIGFAPCRFSYALVSGEIRMLYFNLPHLQLKPAVEYWPLLEALYILLNITWLVLLYWFIRSVLLREVPGMPSPACYPSSVTTPAEGMNQDT